MHAHMTYKALNKALELVATASLFSGSLAAEDLLASGSSIN
jgi:hypothetical protein